MSNMENRLRLHAAVMSLIEQMRDETGDERLGEEIEQVVVAAQFRELEREILDNPGAIEPWLIRRRRREHDA
jgi:hypothetical protein